MPAGDSATQPEISTERSTAGSSRNPPATSPPRAVVQQVLRPSSRADHPGSRVTHGRSRIRSVRRHRAAAPSLVASGSVIRAAEHAAVRMNQRPRRRCGASQCANGLARPGHYSSEWRASRNQNQASRHSLGRHDHRDRMRFNGLGIANARPAEARGSRLAALSVATVGAPGSNGNQHHTEGE